MANLLLLMNYACPLMLSESDFEQHISFSRRSILFIHFHGVSYVIVIEQIDIAKANIMHKGLFSHDLLIFCELSGMYQ